MNPFIDILVQTPMDDRAFVATVEVQQNEKWELFKKKVFDWGFLVLWWLRVFWCCPMEVQTKNWAIVFLLVLHCYNDLTNKEQKNCCSIK